MRAVAIRVVIADDFPLMRRALLDCLANRPDMEVVGEASDGREAVALAKEHQPDVLVLDLAMPNVGGLEALGQLREELPGVRVLVMSASEKEKSVVQAIGEGAAGYITKRSTMDELCDAITTVHGGGAAISPALTVHLLRGLSGDGTPGPASRDRLSARELEIVRLLAQGSTDDEISAELGISPRTVQAHLARVRDKVGVRRRSQLARWAAENGVLNVH